MKSRELKKIGTINNEIPIEKGSAEQRVRDMLECIDSNIAVTDAHSSNVVRINAVVASFDQFYEIYGIEEGDAMYVAPEERLRLW